MYLYETHLHTYPVSACARATPEEQVQAYKNNGYTGVIITDHFLNGNTSCPREGLWEDRINYYTEGYKRALKEGNKIGLDVFFGWEYRCDDGTEFLTYGLDIDFLLKNPGMDKLDIEAYSALVRKNGGYLAQAHPFRTSPWIVKKSAVDHRLIDGVEVFNASMTEEINNNAREFAALHNLPIQSGSDSHAVNLEFRSGIKLSKSAENIFDIISAIKSGSIELILP